MPRLLGLHFSDRRDPRDEAAVAGEHDHITRDISIATLVLVLGGASMIRLWRARFGRVQVAGPSMVPTLCAGDRVLVRRAPRVVVGDLVVIIDPEEPERLLVKRLVGIEAGRLVVVGDNSGASRDSAAFGPIGRENLVGVAWYRYLPLEHAGRLKRIS